MLFLVEVCLDLRIPFEDSGAVCATASASHAAHALVAASDISATVIEPWFGDRSSAILSQLDDLAHLVDLNRQASLATYAFSFIAIVFC